MKVIKTGDEARIALKRGVDAVANIVKTTLGPKGRNVMIGMAYGSPVVTNDGVTIAQNIELEDEIEELGAQTIKNLTLKADQIAGDGTTTTTVIAQAIISSVFDKYVSNTTSLSSKPFNPIQLRKDIDAACVLVVNELKKDTRQISTLEDIKKVALVSVESEPVADIIAGLYSKLGNYGRINVEESENGFIEGSITEGLEFDRGILSPYMANDKDKFVSKNPRIMVTNARISHADHIKPIIALLEEKDIKELVVIGEFEPSMVSLFVSNSVQGGFNVIAIKAPGSGSNEVLKDIAAMTGASFLDKDLYDATKVVLEDLGTCSKLVSDQAFTAIVGASGDISVRVQDIKDTIKASDSIFEKNELENRLSKLTGGIGLIKVGAPTDDARGYLKRKIDDAVKATKAALVEGVVKGGGLALKEIAERLETNILTDAIKAPYEQIQKNCGGIVVTDDIIDPVKVTRTALETACSAAGVFITSEAAIAIKNERKNESED